MTTQQEEIEKNDREIIALAEDLIKRGEEFRKDINIQLDELNHAIDLEQLELMDTEESLVGIVTDGINELEKIQSDANQA